jgi:hypothetical protein
MAGTVAMAITKGTQIMAIMITPRFPDLFRTRAEVCFAKIPRFPFSQPMG